MSRLVVVSNRCIRVLARDSLTAWRERFVERQAAQSH
jgi:hypothetical protein